jgi:hypothetical protein
VLPVLLIHAVERLPLVYLTSFDAPDVFLQVLASVSAAKHPSKAASLVAALIGFDALQSCFLITTSKSTAELSMLISNVRLACVTVSVSGIAAVLK